MKERGDEQDRGSVEGTAEERLAAAIRTLMRALNVGSQTAASKDGREAFSTTELAVLGTILELPGVTAREVAGALTLVPTTVQSILERFSRRDLIVRSRHEVDGRAIALTLSEKGNQTLSSIYATDVINCAAILEALPAHRREAFVHDLTDIASRLAARTE